MKLNEKNNHCFVMYFLLFMFVLSGLQIAAARKNPDKLQVRVFSGTEPVQTLKKDNFQITGKGRQLDITGIKVYKKTLANRDAEPQRILLDFQLHRFDEQVERTVSYLFDTLLRESDNLTVMAGARRLDFESLPDKAGALMLVVEALKAQAAVSLKRMTKEIQMSEKFIDELRDKTSRNIHISKTNSTLGRLQGVHPHYHMKFFRLAVERYLLMSQEYKKNYVAPPFYRYHRLTHELEKEKNTKWFLLFYQTPPVPAISDANKRMIRNYIKELSRRDWLDEVDYSRRLERLLMQLEELFLFSGNKSIVEAANIFYKSNTAFHSVMLPLADSATLTEKRVQKELGEELERMSFQLGGAMCRVPATGSVTEKMEKLRLKEDISYEISYAGEALPGDRKVTVTQVEGETRLFYYQPLSDGFMKKISAKNQAVFEPPVFETVGFTKKQLSLVVTRYFVPGEGSGVPAAKKGDKKGEPKEAVKSGKVHLQIKVIQSGAKGAPMVFNQGKILTAKKDKISITLDFSKRIKKGKYIFILDAVDLLTGSSRLYQTVRLF
ncbi:MAG: hypothetical protein GY757_35575 [bacterium]|nr:hypothetical protein [bacterium]